MSGKKTVLFACIQNAGRSQVAAAFLNQLADPSKVEAVSAGTEPAEKIHPEVIEAMKEVDVDLSSLKPQKLTEELASKANLLITMGCGDACPHIPGLARVDWPLEDPKGQSLEKVREIRDKIRERVYRMLIIEGWR